MMTPLLVLIASLALTWIIMPALIRVAYLKNLVDRPEGPRKKHQRAIPTLGGVAIFLSLMFCMAFWLPRVVSDVSLSASWGVWMAGLVVLFFMGLKDDIVGLSPSKKLIVHLFVGSLLILEGEFRVHSFHGLFGIEELSFYASSAFSLFVYIVVVNSINLVDGVDGLAGGLSAIACCVFAALFWQAGSTPEAVVALSLVGSVLGFLRFNWSPASIFLGDSGSLVIGLTCYVLAVQLMNCDGAGWPWWLESIPKPVMAMVILAYPLVDTLRVFMLRVAVGRSPFSPDRNHLHHRLMALGFGHRRTSTMVFAYALFIIAFNLCLFNWLDWPKTVLFLVGFSCAFSLVLPLHLASLPRQNNTKDSHVSSAANSSSASLH